ncbi:MAG: PA0069 family radical SAM protein [Gemmatimonadales bacterium]|jgi:DNA repair photolyase
MKPLPIRGRGAAENPPNRFVPIRVERDGANPDDPLPRTRFFRDDAHSIIAYNDSPDVGFKASINPYRGCEHGCSYCYSRPNHEYLGLSAGLDFETRIFIKEDAPGLLRRELSSKRWKPQLLALSGVTDPYQPVERRLRLTRRCLEVLAEARNPTAIITKNHLVTRDIDLLAELREYGAIAVSLSITSLKRDLQRVMEPRTSTPERRLEAIRKLAAAGIPAGVMVAPIIPGLTDHEMPDILAAAAEAGATRAGFIMLRLPWTVAPLFEAWMERHFPERKEKVLNRLRDLSDGKLYQAQFGRRQRGEGPFAEQLQQMFGIACNRLGLSRNAPPLSTVHFRRPSLGGQLGLFDVS